jgi:hypothetical protein
MRLIVSKETKPLLSADDQRITIQSNGRVSFYSPLHVETSCSVNVRNYPFDVQTCLVHFDSATYSTAELRLQSAMMTTPMDVIEVYRFLYLISANLFDLLSNVFHRCLAPKIMMHDY